ncbi:uncharacterized protein LOC109595225 [Aethina tumida]|uniref:uncharacterized protein LOC109595225 n=1 Tax=Aethina tumida TaxID=116153 RepID=UPI00096B0CE6|nr:uncharacterized protein LOC109595225 [Aethina tumida]
MESERTNKSTNMSPRHKSTPRPPTRRHPFEMPRDIKIRSMSAIVTSRKDLNKPVGRRPFKSKIIENILKYVEEINNELIRDSENIKSDDDTNIIYKGFITNVLLDIAQKQICTIEKMYLVFFQHIEANKMLDLAKMLDEMRNFCAAIGLPFEHKLYNLVYLPNSGYDSNMNIGDCKVLSRRTSLSRVTEHTEPESPEKNEPSNLKIIVPSPISSFSSIEELPGFQSLQNDNYSRIMNNETKNTTPSPWTNIFKNKKVVSQTEPDSKISGKLCECSDKPVIKINLKGVHLNDDDFILLHCPVYIPKLILEKSVGKKHLKRKHIAAVDTIRIDASVSKIGIEKSGKKREL